MLEKFFVPPTAETKISKHDFTQQTIQKGYGLPIQIKCDIKIIMSQYKILANKMSLLEPKLLTTMYVLNASLIDILCIICSCVAVPV